MLYDDPVCAAARQAAKEISGDLSKSAQIEARFPSVGKNPSISEQGRPVPSCDSASRRHHITACPRRPSPSILQNLIFGTHSGTAGLPPLIAARASSIDTCP